MKFSTQEEYGLRCLLRIASEGSERGLTIPEISKAEGITIHNTAKILRLLRLGGFLESSRGQIGGYSLSRPPEEIYISNILNALGGKLFDAEFCKEHKGIVNICTHSVDCSIRSLWQMLQEAIDGVLTNLTLKDLLASEEQLVSQISFSKKETISL